MSTPRLGTIAGRAILAWDGASTDVAARSNGRWGPESLPLLADWDRFLDWARSLRPDGDASVEVARLGPPVPAPAWTGRPSSLW